MAFHAQPGARNTGDVPAVAAVGGVKDASTTRLPDIGCTLPVLDELLDALLTASRGADTEKMLQVNGLE